MYSWFYFSLINTAICCAMAFWSTTDCRYDHNGTAIVLPSGILSLLGPCSPIHPSQVCADTGIDKAVDHREVQHM